MIDSSLISELSDAGPLTELPAEVRERYINTLSGVLESVLKIIESELRIDDCVITGHRFGGISHNFFITRAGRKMVLRLPLFSHRDGEIILDIMLANSVKAESYLINYEFNEINFAPHILYGETQVDGIKPKQYTELEAAYLQMDENPSEERINIASVPFLLMGEIDTSRNIAELKTNQEKLGYVYRVCDGIDSMLGRDIHPSDLKFHQDIFIISDSIYMLDVSASYVGETFLANVEDESMKICLRSISGSTALVYEYYKELLETHPDEVDRNYVYTELTLFGTLINFLTTFEIDTFGNAGGFNRSLYWGKFKDSRSKVGNIDIMWMRLSEMCSDDPEASIDVQDKLQDIAFSDSETKARDLIDFLSEKLLN